MKKIFYILIHPIRRLYWFIMRPKTYGVKGVVVYQSKILMIQNSYVKPPYWTVPGGGVKRGEQPIIAVRREVKEEVGIEAKKFEFLCSYKNIKEHKRDTVFCYITWVNTDFFKTDPSEILRAQWYPVDDLPKPLPATFNNYIELVREKIHAKN